MDDTSLTTAESLLVETLTLAVLNRASSWLFERRYWIKPQLETLTMQGLLTWCWDDHANFLVTPTPSFRDHPEFRHVVAKFSMLAPAN